jgi:hypothetical protein
MYKVTLGRPMILIVDVHAGEEMNFPMHSTCAFFHFTNVEAIFDFKVSGPSVLVCSLCDDEECLNCLHPIM